MNWKVLFQELTGWRPKNDEERTKNDEERWRIFTKSLTKMSQKHYGRASVLIFFTETIFLSNFKRILNSRRVEPNYSALFPLFIGEKREVVAAKLALASCCFHQKAPPSVGTPRKAQVGLVSIFTPFFTKYTPFCFFCWFFFRNVTEIFGLCNDTYFLSVMLQKLTDYAIIPFFDLWNVVELYGFCDNAPFRLPACRGTSQIT